MDGWRQQSPRGTPPRVEARGPYRPEVVQQLAQDDRRSDRAAAGQGRQMVEQAAGTRCIGAGEDLGLCCDRGAEPAEQLGTPLQTHQRVGVARLEMVAQRIDRQRFQRVGIGAQWRLGPRRKRTAGEHGQACERQPLGSTNLHPGRSVAIGPLRSRTGIQQHTGDGEVERGTRPLGRITPWRGSLDCRPAIVPAHHEVTPARVERHLEIRIGLRAWSRSTRSAASSSRARSMRKCASPSSRPIASSDCARWRTASALNRDNAAAVSVFTGVWAPVGAVSSCRGERPTVCVRS